MKTKTPIRAAGKKPKVATKAATSRNGVLPAAPMDVLTLEETAAFLRVAPDEIEKLAAEGKLPSRRVNGDWRFLKTALCDWLRSPEPPPNPNDWRESNGRLLELAGCMADDDTIPEMLENIYRERKRHLVEEIQD